MHSSWIRSRLKKCTSSRCSAATLAARRSHAAPVLPADFKQCAGDLPKRTNTHRVHQHLEHVVLVDRRLLQSLEHGRRLDRVLLPEGVQPRELRLLFIVGRAGHLDVLGHRVAAGVAKGVDAHDRVFAGVLEHLVVHRLFLNLAALVAGFHGAEHAAAVGQLLELGEHRFFDQLGELFDDESALAGVLVFGQAPLAVDDELDGHGSAHAVGGRRGDGLVERIGVQRVAVVVDRDQRLQRGADVVELDLLRVQ